MLLRSLDAQSIIFITLLLGVYFLSATFNGFCQAAYAKLLGDNTAEDNAFSSTIFNKPHYQFRNRYHYKCSY